MEAKKQNIPENVLTLQMHDINACIDLQCIEKILSLPYLENIPGSAADVVGMMNYAGISVPVIDLYVRLNGSRVRPYSTNDAVIMVRHGDSLTGLIVDQIIDIKKVTKDTIQYTDDFKTNKSHVLATIIFDNSMYVLLKSDSLSANETLLGSMIIEKST